MKIFLNTLVLMLLHVITMSQTKDNKVEVLYFKAQLSCCQARACNALEYDVKKIIDDNFKNKNVSFTEVKLSDVANSELIKKYNAKSQTVVLVSTKKGKQSAIDVSEIVAEYAKNNDKSTFQKKMIEKINSLL